MKTEPKQTGLPDFWRSLRFLRPHTRPLLIGLIAAIGVGVFYTFSVSSVVPLLKVIFADHETLSDWLNRVETQRRLGVTIAPDLPNEPAGLVIADVRPDSPNANVLHAGDRIIGRADKAPPGSYALMDEFAETPDRALENVLVDPYEGDPHPVQLALKASHGWNDEIRTISNLLPQEKDPGSRLLTLAIVMGLLIIAAVLGGICRLLNEGLIQVAVQRAMHDLRSQLADHVLRLPMDWYAEHPPGDTLGRFASDVSKVEVGQATLFGKVVVEPMKAIGVLALTLMIEWRLLLVAVIGLPIGALVIRTFGRQVKQAQRRASQSWGRLLDHLGERLAGIRVVKAYNMEAAESARFEHEGRTLTRAQTHIEWVDAGTKPALEILAVFGVAAFALYGGSRVFSGQLEPHLFFAAVICLGGVFDPVRKLGNVNNRLQAADASARRLFELIDLTTEEPGVGMAAAATAKTNGRAGANELAPLRETIAFEQVSFAYPSRLDKPVLEDITLDIRHGQVVAIVGPNGSGKTTLISLLLRFYKPTAGRILIDGQDIAEVTLTSLRRQIALVTQDSVIFSGTVRSNIAYGRTDVTDEAIIRAARLAHVDDFVQSLAREHNGTLSSGYDAQISARDLSGGQRQRLAIARAMLNDPAILVLDEATSQVDSESERKIQEAMEDVTRGRTTFIIAHRFSTISRADVIVVLNEGRMVDAGRHDELLERSPFYVSLCETQFAAGA